jgi:hypothetical protein
MVVGMVGCFTEEYGKVIGSGNGGIHGSTAKYIVVKMVGYMGVQPSV